MRIQKVNAMKDKIGEETQQYMKEVQKMQDEIKAYKEEIKK